MIRLFGACSAALLAAAVYLSGCGTESVLCADSPVSHTAQDVRSMQRFLLSEQPEEDWNEKQYDLNADGKWNAADHCLMKRELLPASNADTDTLVICFSRTGNTEKIANYIIDLTGADSLVIEAAVPYTDADIRYQDDTCRANQEQNDKSARPEIAALPDSIDAYDVIYLGYPIWWGEEPRIIDTLLEHYDFSEKTVIPFCTSASSGIAASERNIRSLVPIGNQLAGKRFAAGASKADVQSWLDTLEIPEKKAVQKMKLTVNGTTLTAAFSDTQAARELAERLAEAPVTVSLSEYGGFEKVGKLPWTLNRTDVQTETKPGDIMLYQGNQMTVFYGTNTWSYTSLASIEGVTAEELAALFGSGDISVTLSLA